MRGFGAFNIPVPLAQAQTLRAFGKQKRAEDLFRSVIEPTRSQLAENPGNPELLTELAEALVGIGELEAGALTWAQRLKRVFAIDIEICRRCGGKLRVIAGIEEPVVIERILEHLGGDGESVDPAHPSRAPPERDLLF